MHRDFKLANILKHDGQIKIADFGFSKLLGNENFTSTMLGSPLNMAPEVLNNLEYNNKVDIWSIGTVYYELLYGKPPFVAKNMVDLVKLIYSTPVSFDRKVNNISAIAEDAIRKMLVVDPKKRIDWEELFNHKINTYMEDKLKRELVDTMKGEEVELNMSKFYIKNNMVIQHPAEIEKKKELNNFTYNAVNGNVQ